MALAHRASLLKLLAHDDFDIAYRDASARCLFLNSLLFVTVEIEIVVDCGVNAVLQPSPVRRIHEIRSPSWNRPFQKADFHLDAVGTAELDEVILGQIVSKSAAIAQSR